MSLAWWWAAQWGGKYLSIDRAPRLGWMWGACGTDKLTCGRTQTLAGGRRSRLGPARARRKGGRGFTAAASVCLARDEQARWESPSERVEVLVAASGERQAARSIWVKWRAHRDNEAALEETKWPVSCLGSSLVLCWAAGEDPGERQLNINHVVLVLFLPAVGRPQFAPDAGQKGHRSGN